MAGLCQAPVYLSGLQCDIAFETEQDKVTIYPNASCEFFGWVIPLGEGRARVGLCGITNVKEKFQTFISGFNAGSVNFVSGTIPLGTLPKTVADGIMVVGDAAALAKPTSGGGVYTGIRAARHAAEVSKLACETGLTDSTFLSRYEDRWKSDFGKELKTGYKAFRLRQHINPAIMEQIVKEMGNEAIEDLIVRKGDMDRPGQLLSSLLVHPRMIKAGAKIIATSIKNCLQ
jgi:flavin-dependent dehydrogenase